MYYDQSNKFLTRRSFLRNTILGVSAVVAVPAFAVPPGARESLPVQQRKLNLVNAHTGEKLDVVYWRDGEYIPDHLGQINYLLRDHRAEKSCLMDKKLIDFLYQLQNRLEIKERIHVLSGYRTAKTNAYLRKHSLGVARKSFHMQGRAVDIYVPGLKPKEIQLSARRLQLGGVGYYKSAGFVHLDTGYPRYWQRA